MLRASLRHLLLVVVSGSVGLNVLVLLGAHLCGLGLLTWAGGSTLVIHTVHTHTHTHKLAYTHRAAAAVRLSSGMGEKHLEDRMNVAGTNRVARVWLHHACCTNFALYDPPPSSCCKVKARDPGVPGHAVVAPGNPAPLQHGKKLEEGVTSPV